MSRISKILPGTLLAPWLLGLGSAASAQTTMTVTVPNVTIYGIADVGVVNETGGANGAVTTLNSGIQNGSRLGFKGTQDMGNDISALWVAEMGLNYTNGTTNQGGLIFGRQIYAGLSHAKIGALTFGRQYCAVNNGVSAVDPFGGGLEGDAFNLMSSGSMPGTGTAGTGRMNNAIKYTTITWAGFKGEFSYAFGHVPRNNAAYRQLDAGITYTNGPLFLDLAQNVINNADSTANYRVTFFGGTYLVGPVKIALGVAVNKNAFSNAGVPNPDSRDYLGGLTYTYGKHKALASYIVKRDQTDTDNNPRFIGLGYKYALAKTTDIHVSWGHVSNSMPNTVGNAGGFYTVGNAIVTGSGNEGFAVGTQIRF